MSWQDMRNELYKLMETTDQTIDRIVLLRKETEKNMTLTLGVVKQGTQEIKGHMDGAKNHTETKQKEIIKAVEDLKNVSNWSGYMNAIESNFRNLLDVMNGPAGPGQAATINLLQGSIKNLKYIIENFSGSLGQKMSAKWEEWFAQIQKDWNLQRSGGKAPMATDSGHASTTGSLGGSSTGVAIGGSMPFNDAWKRGQG